MISATLSEGSGRRSGVAAALAREAYASLQAVGAIDDADAARLVQIGVPAGVISVAGDTRYDQVWARAQQVATAAPWLERFRATPRVTLVAGSTWPADDAVLLPAWRSIAQRWPGAVRLIIAPHEPSTAHLEPIERWAADAGLHCARLDASDDATADVVLVDRVGVLGELYAVADAAFVGGGFHGAGLHSVLEPAAFGAPVVFGTQYANSRDAALLIGDAAGRSVPDVSALVATLTHWLAPDDAHVRREAGTRARDRVRQGLGAADRATALVLSLLPR
jgi:3-deoxy-D-manno-octulosonic-acid transferase